MSLFCQQVQFLDASTYINFSPVCGFWLFPLVMELEHRNVGMKDFLERKRLVDPLAVLGIHRYYLSKTFLHS